MSQDRVFTGVDGDLQIGKNAIAFAAYTWVGAIGTLPMWTAASSPHPDQLPTLRQPMGLVVRGYFGVGANPAYVLHAGSEVRDVLVTVTRQDDETTEIVAVCDFALVTSFRVGVTAEGNSFFELVLTSSWKYGNFTTRN